MSRQSNSDHCRLTWAYNLPNGCSKAKAGESCIHDEAQLVDRILFLVNLKFFLCLKNGLQLYTSEMYKDQGRGVVGFKNCFLHEKRAWGLLSVNSHFFFDTKCKQSFLLDMDIPQQTIETV